MSLTYHKTHLYSGEPTVVVSFEVGPPSPHPCFKSISFLPEEPCNPAPCLPSTLGTTNVRSQKLLMDGILPVCRSAPVPCKALLFPTPGCTPPDPVSPGAGPVLGAWLQWTFVCRGWCKHSFHFSQAHIHSRLAGSCSRLAFAFLRRQPNGFLKWYHFTIPLSNI